MAREKEIWFAEMKELMIRQKERGKHRVTISKREFKEKEQKRYCWP